MLDRLTRGEVILLLLFRGRLAFFEARHLHFAEGLDWVAQGLLGIFCWACVGLTRSFSWTRWLDGFGPAPE